MKRFDVLGVGINVINLENTIRIMEEWIKNNEQHYVCPTTVCVVMEAQKDATLKKILNSSGLTTSDGMPLVWVGKFSGHSTIGRVYGPDIMLRFSALAVQKGYTNFYYGGASGVPEKLSEKLTENFPGLKVVGAYSPPFRPLTPEEDWEIVDMINRANPDVLWVGLGSPKQDRWMAEHMGRVKAAVMVGVGAAFDFLSGRKKQAPVWIQKSGFEWLFRLLNEPKRLLPRSLYNPQFVLKMMLHYLCK
jgi:N-acetylglucosaminyldiphosphoundecaprenol N-acetyl-beta-D-mannosaminyltransferase